MPTDRGRRGRWAVSAALALLAGGGCSHFQGSQPRQPPGPAAPSTLGTDRDTIPRGQVIPPAGFGVDLVHSSTPAAAARLDPALNAAGS